VLARWCRPVYRLAGRGAMPSKPFLNKLNGLGAAEEAERIAASAVKALACLSGLRALQ